MEDQTIKYPANLENVEYICKFCEFLKVFEKILEDILYILDLLIVCSLHTWSDLLTRR